MKKIIWSLLLFSVSYTGFSQMARSERDAYLTKLRQFFNHDQKALSYQYQIIISGTKEKSSHSLQGIIQIRDKALYDSCQAYVQVKNKDFVFKANYEGKTVSLVNFERYKKLTGIDPEKSQGGLTVNIPMEALDSAISFQLHGEVAEFQFRKQLHGFKYIRFRMSGSQVKEVEMSMTASENETETLYTIKLYNIRQSVNEAYFNHSRFYRISGGKVIYGAAYRNFQHYEVI